MGGINDFLSALQKHPIVLSEKRKEIGNRMTFAFKSAKKIDWKPGQHGIFSFAGRKLKGGSWRGFSVASIPDEGVIVISTRITENPSEFKKALLDLKAGDTISMRGPFGSFYMDDPFKRIVFIAGGMGITPFRAIMHDRVNKTLSVPRPVNLIYIDSKGEYLYKEEIDQVDKENESVEVRYLWTKEELSKEVRYTAERYKNDACYFIAGPSPMVKSIKAFLKEQGIEGKNIKTELFLGYK